MEILNNKNIIKAILLILIFLVIIVSVGICYYTNRNNSYEFNMNEIEVFSSTNNSNEKVENKANEKIYIHVVGEVNNERSYRIRRTEVEL